MSWMQDPAPGTAFAPHTPGSPRLERMAKAFFMACKETISEAHTGVTYDESHSLYVVWAHCSLSLSAGAV